MGVRTIHIPIVHTDLDGSVVVGVTESADGESEGLPVRFEVPLDDLRPVDNGPLAVLVGPADGEERVALAEAKEVLGCKIFCPKFERQNLSVGNNFLRCDRNCLLFV